MPTRAKATEYASCDGYFRPNKTESLPNGFSGTGPIFIGGRNPLGALVRKILERVAYSGAAAPWSQEFVDTSSTQRFKTMSPDTDQELTNLEQLLDRVGEAAKEGDPISLDKIMDWVGRRSFGPLLLVAGLVTVLPIIGDIPGVPTIMGVFVALIAGQLLLRRDHIWLPQWMLERSVSRDTLQTALEWMRSPAQYIDRFLRPRLTVFTHHAAAYAIAVACIVIAAAMPVMEVIPFSANLAGAALTAFGLSLIAHDGLLSLFAFAFTFLTFGVVVYNIL